MAIPATEEETQPLLEHVSHDHIDTRPRATFLSLPFELRHHIYLLGNHSQSYHNIDSPFDPPNRMENVDDLIADEFRALTFDMAVFMLNARSGGQDFDRPAMWRNWIERITEKDAGHVRNLVFEFYDFRWRVKIMPPQMGDDGERRGLQITWDFKLTGNGRRCGWADGEIVNEIGDLQGLDRRLEKSELERFGDLAFRLEQGLSRRR